jgi:hypothetical protein
MTGAYVIWKANSGPLFPIVRHVCPTGVIMPSVLWHVLISPGPCLDTASGHWLSGISTIILRVPPCLVLSPPSSEHYAYDQEDPYHVIIFSPFSLLFSLSLLGSHTVLTPFLKWNRNSSISIVTVTGRMAEDLSFNYRQEPKACSLFQNA